MGIVGPYCRARFRQKDMERIRAEIRRKYTPQIKHARTRAERNAVKAKMKEEIEALIEPLKRAEREDGVYCL